MFMGEKKKIIYNLTEQRKKRLILAQKNTFLVSLSIHKLIALYHNEHLTSALK